MAGGTPVQNSNETKSHSTDVSDGQELFKRDLQMPEKRIRRYYSITDFEIRHPRSDRRQQKWNVRFFIRNGYNLPDKDGLWNKSDPYVDIIVFRLDGTHMLKTTSADGGDLSPEWYEAVYFGSDQWIRFIISVWDDDPTNGDDRLSDDESNDIIPGVHSYLQHNCYRGYIKYDYVAIRVNA